MSRWDQKIHAALLGRLLTVRSFTALFISAAKFGLHQVYFFPGDGTLVETERELLAPTTAFNQTPKGIIKMKGPLVLAKYGDEWSPIFEDYLRGDMSIGNSAKELITTTCSGRVVA